MTQIDDIEKRLTELESTVESLGVEVDSIDELIGMYGDMLTIINKHLEAALGEIIMMKFKNKKDEGITDAY